MAVLADMEVVAALVATEKYLDVLVAVDLAMVGKENGVKSKLLTFRIGV